MICRGLDRANFCLLLRLESGGGGKTGGWAYLKYTRILDFSSLLNGMRVLSVLIGDRCDGVATYPFR